MMGHIVTALIIAFFVLPSLYVLIAVSQRYQPAPYDPFDDDYRDDRDDMFWPPI